jgi:hypothetical protein
VARMILDFAGSPVIAAPSLPWGVLPQRVLL